MSAVEEQDNHDDTPPREAASGQPKPMAVEEATDTEPAVSMEDEPQKTDGDGEKVAEVDKPDETKTDEQTATSEGEAKPAEEKSDDKSGEEEIEEQEYSCDICKKTLNCEEQYDLHMSGKSHQKAIRKRATSKPFPCLPCLVGFDSRDELEVHKNTLEHIMKQQTANAEKKIPRSNRILVESDDDEDEELGIGINRCELCDVTFTCTSDRRKHLNGKRHQKKLKAAPTISDEVIQFCEICNIEFTQESQFSAHLGGKKHLKKLKRFQEEGPPPGHWGPPPFGPGQWGPPPFPRRGGPPPPRFRGPYYDYNPNEFDREFRRGPRPPPNRSQFINGRPLHPPPPGYDPYLERGPPGPRPWQGGNFGRGRDRSPFGR